MAITPGAGYMVDPSNANGVVPIPVAPSVGATPNPAQFGPQTPTTPVNNSSGNQLVPVLSPYLQALADKAANQGKPGYDALGNKLAPPTEPAVVSSSAITDKAIPDAKQAFKDLSQKGTYQDQGGALRYSDGSLVSAPLEATYDGSAWKTADGQTYASPPQYIDNPSNDPDIANENRLMASIKASTDAVTAKQISGIQSQYDALKTEQEATNNEANSARTRVLLTSGASRYSPLTASGTMLAQAKYGLQQIQKLDAEENTALAAAESAQQQSDFSLMSKALDAVASSRAAKQAAAAKVADQLSQATAAAQKATIQASRDNAIADLMSQGVTDPKDILDALNHAGQGPAIPGGGDFTAEEVNNAIKNLTPAKSTEKDLYNFSNADTGKLLAAGLNGTAIQQIQDYYNGHGQAPANLTQAQTATVESILNGKSGGSGSGTGGVIQSGKLVLSQSDIEQGKKALQGSASQGEEADGTYADPNLYLQMYEHWVNSGGKAADFIKQYPFSTYINPKNSWVSTAMSEFNKSVSSSDSSGGGEQAP